MAKPQKESNGKDEGSGKVLRVLLWTGIIVAIIIFIVFIILILLGPIIGDVFSDIVNSMEMPGFTPEVSHVTATAIYPYPSDTPISSSVTQTATLTPAACEPPPGWVPYTLQSGDILSSLAQQLGITVDQLQEANCLGSTTIFIGQTLYVPAVPALPLTDITIDVGNAKLGEVEISYPLRLSPKSSNTVSLSISRPAEIAASDPIQFVIVEINEDTINTIPPIHGDLFSDKATILVDELMKAELSAEAFEVTPLFPVIQAVDLDNVGIITNWAWSIIAPESEGVHVLNFSVYVDEETDTPSWFGAYQVEVLTPTAIPSPTHTPSPTLTTLQKVGENLISESTKLLLELIALIGTISAGIFGIIRTHLKRQDEIADLKKKLETATKKEKQELNEKITKLESIKWWQFWK
jgi:LysM repeat protein